MSQIQIRYDQKRGCGWRQPGGLYLIAAGISTSCGLLPVPLSKCPTCSCGIKPSRGFTWIDIKALTKERQCAAAAAYCGGCPVSSGAIGKRQGLLWIGGAFYQKPEDWTNEAVKQGISRRLSTVPRDFELGKTWVMVAHRAALQTACPDCVEEHCETCQDTHVVPQAAIFHAFKPTAIEYVVRGDESEEDLDRLIKRGITPVQIVRVDEVGAPLSVEEEDDDEDETTVDQSEQEEVPQFVLFN